MAIYRQLQAEGRDGYVSPVAFGTIALGLGHNDEALDWIQRSIDERRGWFVYAHVNPMFDPLRDHARFITMARQVPGREVGTSP
jgi:hypothetical protein